MEDDLSKEHPHTLHPNEKGKLPASLQEQQEDDNLEEKVINEEYKTWKKNAPFLYDMMLSTALEWPTLTTQWFPDKQSYPDKNYSTHRLLIGTHTSSEAPNYLQIAHVQLPNSQKPDIQDYDEERGEIGGYGGPTGTGANEAASVKFNIVQKIDHPGEVNKARYMPQNPNLIATMCIDGSVMIWDKTKHTSVPNGTVNPQVELAGHKSEGFGLSWNPHEQGHLATGSEDATVRLWDITSYTKSKKVIGPARTYTHHSAIVNDVQYHPHHNALFGSVSDDNTLQVVDMRESSTSISAVQGSGHDDAINALSFNPASEYILATASADKTIGIWDLRNLNFKLHALEGHSDAVTSLAWHPFEEAVLGSASYDRRIIFWDLSKVGEEQTPDDQEDGPPELMFMHGGHTNRISDFSWNLNDPWAVCSAAEDNLIQVWRVANAIVGKDTEDIPVEELEQ
ncbi:MAG: Histone acetyltransferase type B subunit 2 [Chaenotheca gracillima]|nr:MAG: Histone acetyltransferase type B subunit 2 [Chaenotheca gracillima]